MTTGLSILLAGALVGGVTGISTREHQKAADPVLSVQQTVQVPEIPDSALRSPAPVVLSSATTLLPGDSPAAVPRASALPTEIPRPKSAVVPPRGRDAKDAKKVTPHPGAITVKGVRGGHPSTAAKVGPSKEKKDRDKDDGYTIASAGSGNDPKEADPAGREAKEPPAKRSGSKTLEAGTKTSEDAKAVLRAAMGATENTL